MNTTPPAQPSTERGSAPRRPWSPPALEAMPPLTELTLQSFIPGSGWIGDGGGSTVF